MLLPGSTPGWSGRRPYGVRSSLPGDGLVLDGSAGLWPPGEIGGISCPTREVRSLTEWCHSIWQIPECVKSQGALDCDVLH